MTGRSPAVAAPEDLVAIRNLPACYGEIVRGVMAARRLMALSAIARDAETISVVRSTQVTSRAYLSVAQGKGVRFFFRRPPTEEVVLEMDTGFSVTPLMRSPADDREAPPLEVGEISSITAMQPPFFGDGIPPESKALLAEALGKGRFDEIAFADLGDSHLGVTQPSDVRVARVAYMQRGEANARIVFPTSPRGAKNLSYEPEAFRKLLDEVARWARNSFKSGEPWMIELEHQSNEAIPQILRALVSGWSTARKATVLPPGDPLRDLMPDLEILNYRAAVTLRLQPNGQLATKPDNDNFSLEMSVAEQDGQLKLAVGPPDFLVSGPLREQIMAEVLTAKIIERWAKSAELDEMLGHFEIFVRAAAPQALVFRGEKQGSSDTEILVFDGEWAGKPRKVIASIELKVKKIDGEFQLNINEDSAKVVYLTDAPPGFEHGIAFPKFLLSLIDQLRNWENSFE